jgi:hypothetical protein
MNKQTYQILENYQQHEQIIQNLVEQNLELTQVIDLDYEDLKSLLEEIDDIHIHSFWEDLQTLKNSKLVDQLGDYNREELKDFIDICRHLIESSISLADLQGLDDDAINYTLSDFHEAKIIHFLKTIRSLMNAGSNLHPIIQYFQSKSLEEDYLPMIEHIISSNISFDELLMMNIEELFQLLSGLDINITLKNNFISIISLESFFNKNNFKDEISDNIKNICLQKKISLIELFDYSKSNILELILFLSITNLIETLPKLFVDNLIQNKFPLSELTILKKDELMRFGLEEEDFNILSNSLDIYKQCSLRQFSIFILDYIFLQFICPRGLTMKQIDEWLETEYDKIPNLKNKDKIIQLLKQKSEIEIFLSDVKINTIDIKLLNVIKYIEYETIRTWKLNNFINLKLGKFVPLYQEIIKKMETYLPHNKFEQENTLRIIKIKLN